MTGSDVRLLSAAAFCIISSMWLTYRTSYMVVCSGRQTHDMRDVWPMCAVSMHRVPWGKPHRVINDALLNGWAFSFDFRECKRKGKWETNL